MANNNSGSSANKSCNQKNLNSPSEQFECSSSLSQLSISQAGSEFKEAGLSTTTGSALGEQKSPHNPYWAYSQLPSATTISTSSLNQTSTFASSTNQTAINTTTSSTGTVFSRGQDNVSPPAKELSSSSGLIGLGKLSCCCFAILIANFKKFNFFPSTSLVGPAGIVNNPNPGYRQNTQSNSQFDLYGHGHFFTKKTFHRPTYCNHCTDLLWLVEFKKIVRKQN